MHPAVSLQCNIKNFCVAEIIRVHLRLPPGGRSFRVIRVQNYVLATIPKTHHTRNVKS
jgi:hypothetical protein